MIEVKYKNIEEQFLDFAMYRAVNSKSYKRNVKIKTAMISLMLIISSIAYGYVSVIRSNDEKVMKVGFIFSAIFFILGIVTIFVYPKYIHIKLKNIIMNQLKNSNDLFGKTIKVNFDGKIIEVFSGKSKLKIDMNSILDVVEMNGYVGVATQNYAGLVIPISSFKNEQDKADFIADTKAYLDKNK
ncbi:MAG TPA: hypothetical protein DG753_07885 [Clostridium sp.]|nr:hypothetical protein [Clostridium sp.]